MSIIGYHTANSEKGRLYKPLYCHDNKAWLGPGYYFWQDLDFAKRWASVKKYRLYDVYTADLNTEHCLDTVYSEEADKKFNEWLDLCDNLIRKRNLKIKPEDRLSTIFNLMKKEVFKKLNITGIRYADIPQGELDSKYKPLYPQKRIQYVIYSDKDIRNFSILIEKERVK
ncbi:MAG: hypothetical protein IJ180_00395 [Bacteroidales bacterium]|nr:hypothetical protein [Bacteroidales bacterium]